MRPVYCLVPVLLAALVGVLTYDPGGMRPWPWDAEDLADRLEVEKLSARDRTVERRQVGADLARGRLTADEAAARMAELNRSAPAGSLTHVQVRYPQATDEALAHWLAVRFARQADPQAGGRLAEEYRRRFPDGPDPEMSPI